MSRSFARTVAGFGAAVLLGTLGALAPGVAAQAAPAYACSQNHVKTMQLRNASGTVVGKLGIYRTGTKVCAVAMKAGPLYGVESYMSLAVSTKGDEGRFKYQTRAITVDSRNAYRGCVGIQLAMKNRNGNWLPTPQAYTQICP